MPRFIFFHFNLSSALLRRLIFLLFFVGSVSLLNAQNKKDEIEFNFSNFELINLVDLMSKLGGRTFLYEERDIKGKKISLVTPGKYSKAQALAIFEAILDVNGLTTIRYDNFTRIVNKNAAKREQTPLVGKSRDSFYDFVTRIIRLNNINVNTARSTITPLISTSTTLVQYAPANILIIRDTSASSARIIRLLRAIDKPGNKIRIERFRLESADVNQTSQFITRVASRESSRRQAQPPIVIPDITSNSIIVAGDDNDLAIAKQVIKQLDVKQAAAKLQIFRITNNKASDLKRILTAIFKIGKGSSINIVEDNAFNRLIVTARPETLDKIKVLISELDKYTPRSLAEYRVFRLSNANAKEIAPVLQKATGSISLIAQNSKDGKQAAPVTQAGSNDSISIIADEATNSLVVYADSSEFEVIERVIRDLDIRRPQVFVEALIVELSLDKSLNLGVDWKASGEIKSGGDTEAVYTISNRGNANPSTFAGAAASSPEGGAIGILGKSIPFGDQSFSSFSAFILANRTDSEINILSNPKILTLNNKEAEIKVGEVRPFQTQLKIDSNGAESRSFDYKEVGVNLKITPQINPDGTIKMSILQSSKEVRTSTESSSQDFTPVTLERQIKSEVVVGDSEIIALGGLINDSVEQFESKVPCLGDIPLLGWLFKTASTKNSKVNLMVFLTPTIIQGSEDVKALTEKTKDNFSAAADKNFRLDISEELGIPTIQIPLPEKDEDEERKIYRFRNIKSKSLEDHDTPVQKESESEELDFEDSQSEETSPELELESGEISGSSSTPTTIQTQPKVQNSTPTVKQ